MNKAKLIVFLSIFSISLASYLSFFAYKQTNTYKAKAECSEWGRCHGIDEYFRVPKEECKGIACEKEPNQSSLSTNTTTTTTNTQPRPATQNTTISKGALFTQGSITATIDGYPELVLNTLTACSTINPPANCYTGIVNQNSITFTFTPQNTNPVPVGVCGQVAQAYQQQIGATIECLQFVN